MSNYLQYFIWKFYYFDTYGDFFFMNVFNNTISIKAHVELGCLCL